MYPLGMGRIGEGHVSTDDPSYRLGVTFSSVPAPRLSGAEAYMDHAQWVIEEIKPHITDAS